MAGHTDRQSFLRSSMARLPPGFRFNPTDEELVVHYLRRKALSFPLPASIIPEIDGVRKLDPWDLLATGEEERERYFFDRSGGRRRRLNRATESGYWKATGRDKAVVAASRRSDAVVGMKKTLVFYKGKTGGHGSRTDWIMHEYRLVVPESGDLGGAIVPSENWVLCRVFKKRRAAKMAGGGGGGIDFVDSFRREVAAVTEEESSCITDASDGSGGGGEEEEESSCCSFP